MHRSQRDLDWGECDLSSANLIVVIRTMALLCDAISIAFVIFIQLFSNVYWFCSQWLTIDEKYVHRNRRSARGPDGKNNSTGFISKCEQTTKRVGPMLYLLRNCLSIRNIDWIHLNFFRCWQLGYIYISILFLFICCASTKLINKKEAESVSDYWDIK